MNRTYHKLTRRDRRHRRVRKRVHGTADRPRLCVFRSLRRIYTQIIDDEEGRTLVAASSLDPDLKAKGNSQANKTTAKEVGKILGERAKAAGITRVVFDRGGYLYHGRIQAVAEGAREAGLEF